MKATDALIAEAIKHDNPERTIEAMANLVCVFAARINAARAKGNNIKDAMTIAAESIANEFNPTIAAAAVEGFNETVRRTQNPT